jgi:uncharacterized protein
MTETLPRLLALQACDQRIRQVTHTLNTLQQSLAILKEDEQAQARDIRTRQDTIREAEQTRAHLTLQLDQVQGQLRDRRHALYSRRAGPQGETVQREVVRLEANKVVLEEDLQAVVAHIAEATAALHQLEDMASVRHEERLDAASSPLSQIAATEEELRVIRENRLALTRGISEFLLQEYERIFAHRGGVAVVALVAETCQGCHMHLPPQTCLDLQRHARLSFCPHCHRILFVPTEASLPRVASLRSSDTANNGHRTHQPQRRPRARTRTGKKLLEAESPPTSPAQA